MASDETKTNDVSRVTTASNMILTIEKWKKQKRWAFIAPQELGEMMKNINLQKQEDGDVLQVVDVRHSDQDHIGGHIKGSTNIDHRGFAQSLPNSVQKYAKKHNFEHHCMYSQCRGLRCLRAYRDYIDALIGGQYYRHLKDVKDGDTEMMVPYKDLESKQQAFKLTADLAQNIMNQRIWVLKGGFNAWLTFYYGMEPKERQSYISDFDGSYWSITTRDKQIELKHKHDW